MSPLSVSANEILVADVRTKMTAGRDLSTTLEPKGRASRKPYTEAEKEQGLAEYSHETSPFAVCVSDVSPSTLRRSYRDARMVEKDHRCVSVAGHPLDSTWMVTWPTLKSDVTRARIACKTTSCEAPFASTACMLIAFMPEVMVQT